MSAIDSIAGRTFNLRSGIRDHAAVCGRHAGDGLRALVAKSYAVFGIPRSRRWSGGRTGACAGTVARADAGVQGRGAPVPGQPVRVRAGQDAAGELNILAATSGDTGSAAIYGVRGRKGIRIFVMHPHGRRLPDPGTADDHRAGRQRPQHRRRGHVRRLPADHEGAVRRPGVQATATRSARSTRSTGRACWRRSSTTSTPPSACMAATGAAARAGSRCPPATSATSSPAGTPCRWGCRSAG